MSDTRYTLYLGEIPVRHFCTWADAMRFARRLPAASRREAKVVGRDRAYPFKHRASYGVEHS